MAIGSQQILIPVTGAYLPVFSRFKTSKSVLKETFGCRNISMLAADRYVATWPSAAKHCPDIVELFCDD
jgi:hypothetical protein